MIVHRKVVAGPRRKAESTVSTRHLSKFNLQPFYGQSPDGRLTIQNAACRSVSGNYGSEIVRLSFSSGQVYAPEEIFKALVRAVSVKNRIDGKVSHPDGAIVICGLQPFECVFLIVQGCVDLSEAVGRNVTLCRHRLQFMCNPECVTLPTCRCKGDRDLRGVKWTASRQTRRPRKLSKSFTLEACLIVVLAEQQVRWESPFSGST